MAKAQFIDHIALVSKDLDETIKFYTETFGFKLISQEDIPPLGMKNAIMKLEGDGCILESVQFTDGRDFNYEDGIYELMSLNVEDVFAVEAELKAKGIEFLVPEPLKMGDEGFFTFLRGPSGEKIELIQVAREK